VKRSSATSTTIGLVSLVCLIIGNMIGSGVYISSSYALGALGDARLVLVAWLIGGLHAICGAIAYAALARRVRLSGGEYAFLTRYVHPAIGLMAGWISLTAGFAAPVAAAALVFGEYILEAKEPTWQARCLATLWIALCAWFHAIDLRTGSWVNNAIVGLKMVGFSIFIASSLWFLQASGPAAREAFAWHESLLETSYLSQLLQPSVWMVIAVQLFFISLSYTGYNASIYIADEISDPLTPNIHQESQPSPQVWKSMIAASIFVTLIYLGLNGLFLACSTSDRIISGGDYFVSNVAYDVGGESLQWVMRFTIVISSATSVLAMTATGPRVFQQMANDRRLPRAFRAPGQVPRLAILAQAATSAAFVWLASVKQLVDYLGLTLTACGAVATSTLWFAYREMHSIRPVRWWEHFALFLYIVGAVVLLAAAAQLQPPVQFWLCIGTCAIGILVYFFSPGKR
jgi:amino acid transporter